MHVPNRLALFDGIYIFRIDALIVPNTLLYKRFVETSEIVFLEADAAPASAFCS